MKREISKDETRNKTRKEKNMDKTYDEYKKIKKHE
jgi:hypothetical protein